jgi:hypothetical protein
MQLDDFEPCFPSPREAAGRDQGWGVAPRMPLPANFLIDPPPPTPQNELRSSRPRHALTRAEGGEKKMHSNFKQHIPSLRAPAKQSMAQRAPNDGLLRRFAPRNDDRHKSAFSRHVSPEFWPAHSALSKQRAQGMPGARCARGHVCEGRSKKHTRQSGHTGITRHSPRNGFTTYFVLSPVIGLFCHRHQQITPPT